MAEIETTPATTETGFDTVAWRSDFEERAAIAEIDQGLPRAEAEASAGLVSQLAWMRAHPPRAVRIGLCAYCVKPTDPDNSAPASGIGLGARARLHLGCSVPFFDAWRRAADEAMRLAGFPPTASRGPSPRRSRFDELYAAAVRDFKQRCPKRQMPRWERQELQRMLDAAFPVEEPGQVRRRVA